MKPMTTIAAAALLTVGVLAHPLEGKGNPTPADSNRLEVTYYFLPG